MTIKAFKYRLWTNANQERELDIVLETHRRLYNQCLAMRKESYEKDKTSLTYYDQSKWFTTAKQSNEWFRKINAQSAQQTMKRLDKAFQAFFRRMKTGQKPGYPRFKSFCTLNSMTFPQFGSGVKFVDEKLRIQHVGLVRVKLHRPWAGTIKRATILKECGRWYVILTCESEEKVEPSYNQEEIGIDVGLTKFLTTSDGETVENPRLAKVARQNFKRAQHSLSRKKKGSNRRKKARRRLARLHQKVRNQRSDFHWKTANDLVKRFGKIAVESLNVQGMLERGNRRISRSIADVGWSSFLSKLKFKAESAGVLVVEVDCRGTSQVCAECGLIVPKTLKDRWHSCECGYEVDRDHNSAKEVLRRGKAAWAGPSVVKVGVG